MSHCLNSWKTPFFYPHVCQTNSSEPKSQIYIYTFLFRFFTSSVKAQPGLIQLLLSTDSAEDNGCLKSILVLLQSLKETPEPLLHVQLIEFVFNLWSHNLHLAVSSLKKRPDFWPLLTWPLFSHKNHTKNTNLNGYILRILSAEIFAFKSGDKELLAILEKLFDDKSKTIRHWCDLVINNSSRQCSGDVSVLSVNGQLFHSFLASDTKNMIFYMISDPSADDESSQDIFLLGSWKTLLMVLSKDQPIVLSPNVCHLITLSLMEAIRNQLTGIDSTPNIPMTTSLTETLLVLMQRWHTKAAGDSMAGFMTKMSLMLDEFSSCYEALHPRARVAMLAIGVTSLKASAFKMEATEEKNVLMKWLEPTTTLVEKSMQNGTYNIFVWSK